MSTQRDQPLIILNLTNVLHRSVVDELSTESKEVIKYGDIGLNVLNQTTNSTFIKHRLFIVQEKYAIPQIRNILKE